MRYEIKQGDTLSQIAQKFGQNYLKLASHNNIDNPDYIRAGQIIDIPTRDMEAQVQAVQQAEPEVVKQAETRRRRRREPTPREVREVAPTNPRQNRTRSTAAPTESQGLMMRGIRRGRKKQVEFQDPAFVLDPIKILSQQALLSIAERGAKAGIIPFQIIKKGLDTPITEEDISKSVLRAMRRNTIRMFETGAPSMDDEFLGVGTRGDITAPFEGIGLLGGDPEKVKGIEAFTQYFTDPSKTQAFVTGETTRGNITLDENNNMILNDSYDFPDYDESKAKDLFMRIHNMFEPRGQTGKEGLLSGIFEVDQPRKMRINLGPAPKAIAALINPKEERSLLVAGL